MLLTSTSAKSRCVGIVFIDGDDGAGGVEDLSPAAGVLADMSLFTVSDSSVEAADCPHHHAPDFKGFLVTEADRRVGRIFRTQLDHTRAAI